MTWTWRALGCRIQQFVSGRSGGGGASRSSTTIHRACRRRHPYRRHGIHRLFPCSTMHCDACPLSSHRRGGRKGSVFLRAPESWAMVRRTAHQTDSVHSRRRGRLVWMRWESVGATCQTVGDVAASRRSVAS
ncbi:hypothetical protein BU14_0365s0007 [Porphyra umbilicalis]|uniref:Uncharacterized protein n=1 Tax=Porphyra umbilicalis TaxID=2786 RepID=A0A1X6NX65_PORUM|nr:hypothetical protein BU14_0365s0007 [Porphyra umbilicalis]|eukprot:OSX73239.1 hypothetical protein BU14_0365s0007 [Porphyra umbilicalis]